MTTANLNAPPLTAAGQAITTDIHPTPKQIDEMIEHFEQLRDEAELADERYEDAKEAIIGLVQRFGSVPAGAEHSLRLQGALTITTITAGNTIKVKEEAVGDLKAAMQTNGRLELFDLMFAQRTKHELQKDAEKQLRLAKLPQRLVKLFTQLYARCFEVNKKYPSLKIEHLDGIKSAKKRKSQPRAAGKAAL